MYKNKNIPKSSFATDKFITEKLIPQRELEDRLCKRALEIVRTFSEDETNNSEKLNNAFKEEFEEFVKSYEGDSRKRLRPYIWYALRLVNQRATPEHIQRSRRRALQRLVGVNIVSRRWRRSKSKSITIP